MKKKFQAAENYLTAQTKGFQEKLEFIKTHGKLFEIIMSSLERQKEDYKSIIEVFQRLALQLSNFYPDTASLKENVEQVHEWAYLPLIKNIKQSMTQEQMKAICKSIDKDAYSVGTDVLHKYVIIEFDEGDFIWDEMVISLNHAVVEIEIDSVDPSEGRSDCFDLRLDSRMNTTIYMHDKDDWAQAFLKATGDDGQDYFFELKRFAMLFLHLHDPEDENEKSDCKNDELDHSEDTAAEDSSEDRNVGLFTLFNKAANNLLFTTEY